MVVGLWEYFLESERFHIFQEMVVSNGDFLSASGFQLKPRDLEEGAECRARS